MSSIGNLIYLAGRKRFACPHSTFFFHGTSWTFGAEADVVLLRRTLDIVERIDSRTAEIISDETSMPLQKVRELLDGSQTLDAQAARSAGLVHEVVPFALPSDATLFQATTTQ